MNLIWITTQFPSNPADTKGKFIFRTVKELSNHYNITLICLHSIVPPILPMIKDIYNAKKIYKVWRNKYPHKPQAPQSINFNVIYAKYARLPRRKFQYIEGFLAYQGVKKYLKKIIEKDSIIHATWLFPEGDLAKIISKKYDIPFIVTLMGSDVHFLEVSSKKWRNAKKIIHSARFVTSVSTELYNSLEKKNLKVPEDKKSITHTVYEFDKFVIKNKLPIRNKYGISEQERVIFFAGTLRKIKNIDFLIESIGLLQDSKIPVKLLIAGIGEEAGNLKNLVKHLSLENNVDFVGGLAGNEIIDYYNLADVFCLPSQNEGLPNVIIESLLCGTPVVATSVGEIPHIIKDNINGFLVEPNSPQSLREKLNEAINFEWNRNKLRESVLWLSPENVLEEYKHVYSKTANQRIFSK